MKTLVLFVFCFVLLGFVVYPMFDYPLEQDEAVTGKLFSSLGYTQTMEEMRAWPRFDFKRFARGVGKCFVNDWDPNNHIVNSLAVSVSIFLLGVNETAMRIPAFMGAGVAVFLLMLLVRRLSGSDWFAGLAGLLMISFPMFTDYAALSRGYTITIAIVCAQILWLDMLISRKAVRVGDWIGLILLSLASFFNLASMLFMWVVPLYICMMLCLPRNSGNIPAKSAEFLHVNDRALWGVQFLCVILAIGAFILSSLRQFLTAQAHYGIKSETRGESIMVLARIFFTDLFPGVWLIWFVLGGAGILLTCFGKRSCWISRVVCGSLLFSVIYSLLSKSAGYPRTYIVYSIFAALGSALLWRLSSGRRMIFKVAIIVLLVCVAMVGVSQQVMARKDPPSSYNYMAETIKRKIEKDLDQNTSYMVLLPYVYGCEMTLYLPWDMVASINPPLSSGSELTLFVAAERMRTAPLNFGVWCIPPDRRKSIGQYWPIHGEWDKWLSEDFGKHRLYSLPMMVSSVDDEQESGEAFIGVWVSEEQSTGAESFLRDKLSTGKYPWVLPVVYYPAGDRYILAMLGSSSDDLDAAREALHEFKAQNGGYVALLGQLGQ